MKKYDALLDINEDNSASLILREVKKNSTVLEFGPANGRLTRYLKNELNCDVYIVEIDEEFFADAIEFAKDGICDDILNYKWLEKYGHITFDHIIFADVLEHIYEPRDVVEKSMSLLKDDGTVHVSVPNIAHNSIIIDLIKNKFEYRETGLLDKTHIRFFTYYSLLNLLESCGLYSILQQATYCHPAHTEFSNNYTDLNFRTDVLEHKNFENVYQFIFKCVRKDYYLENKNSISVNNTIINNFSEEKISVFVNTGNGFSEETKYTYQYIKNPCDITIKLPEGVKQLRFDPIDGKGCILKNLEISCDTGLLDYVIVNGITVDNLFVFATKDPQVLVELSDKSVDTVYIKCEIYNFTLNEFDFLESFCNAHQNLEHEQAEKAAVIEQLTQAQAEKAAVIENLEQEKAEKAVVIENLEQEKAEKAVVIENLEQEKAEKAVVIENLEQEKAEKAVVIENLEHEKVEKAAVTEKFEHELAQNIALWDKYNQQVYNYEAVINSNSWKITKPLRDITSFARKLIHSNKYIELAIKGLISVRYSGIKKTWLKIKKWNYVRKTSSVISPGKSLYKSEYQENIDFSAYTPDVKAIAFYLPQFHTIPENDVWWGEGFVEWVNTKKGEPKFSGHYQPRTPHKDIGYYDLSDINTMANQAKLAKQHGIYGFCFYYYWFSGKRLLEKPVDMLLEHPEIDINFCLCWANENWTRAWDGQNKDVLIKQDYSQNDMESFIVDIEKYISDSRYIRINGKPLIIVYNPGHIPDCKELFLAWRKFAKEKLESDILIYTCQTSNNTAKLLKIENYIDGEIQFPPHNMWYESIGVRGIDVGGKECYIYDYEKLVDIIVKEEQSKSDKPLYQTCMMGWDNSARRKTGFTCFVNFSLKSYYAWLNYMSTKARKLFCEDERFIFINAWNEWAEGTYLDPDEKYGYSNINTTSKAILGLPFDENFKIINYENKSEFSAKIAIQIHCFYIDTLDDIVANLNFIPLVFDCYVSTDTSEKQKIITEELKLIKNLNKLCVEVFTNKGRDVAPFIIQMKKHIKKYDFICHIHSKKSTENNYGELWRTYLYRHLFGSSNNILNLLNEFKNNPKLGIIFPKTYPILRNMANWGDNEPLIQSIFDRLNLDISFDDECIFPVGNMFWARTQAILPMFTSRFTFDDFQEEMGQVNFTIAHAIERSWVYIAKSLGYTYLNNFNLIENKYNFKQHKIATFFVHHDINNIISDNDLILCRKLSEISTCFIFISNSDLREYDINKIKEISKKVIIRENVGYDFGAWRDALNDFGFNNLEKYDKLILANNSVYGPVYPLDEMFSVMEAENVDFWGVTLFPEFNDGSYLGKHKIEEHLQSYFQVFNSSVIKNENFKNFWQNVLDYRKLKDVISNCETLLTELLYLEGFTYSAYIKESKMCLEYFSLQLPYEFPYQLLLMGCPFIKKKSLNHMSIDERVGLNNFITDTLN